MHFVLVAYDGTDQGAMDRRMAVREAHLTLAQEMIESGQWLYACGIQDDEERLIGSMIVCDFASRDEMEDQWLKREPYVVGDVWRTIKIHRALVPQILLERTGSALSSQ
jgi:uncharacterized protein YciI